VSAQRRHLGAGAALSVVVQGGPLAAGAVLSIVLARTIGPSGNGRFALLVTLSGLTVMVVSLGLASGITYEVSRARWSVRGAARTSYAAGLVLGLVGFIGGLALFWLLHDSVFHGISTWLAVVALASLPPVIAYQFADSILLARERYESYAALELAHSLTELGAALRRAGERTAGREALGEALELAVRCGGRRLAGRAREELKATGARPRREWRTGVESLTPSELRIVRLAAEGRTNREIAHELYVTLKTVEGHLSRAYSKLGIEGRGALPDVLGREKTGVSTL